MSFGFGLFGCLNVARDRLFAFLEPLHDGLPSREVQAGQQQQEDHRGEDSDILADLHWIVGCIAGVAVHVVRKLVPMISSSMISSMLSFGFARFGITAFVSADCASNELLAVAITKPTSSDNDQTAKRESDIAYT